MKVLIAVPTFETICPETFRSLWALKSSAHEVDFEFVKGYDCARARNKIGEMARKRGYEYVLMLDSDMEIPRDALEKLTEFPVDVCLGVSPKKNTATGETTLFKSGTADFTEVWHYDELPDGVNRMTVRGGGFGCVLIRTELFNQLEYPWFQYTCYPNGSVLSEDLYFCEGARLKGFKVEADLRVRCGHLTRKMQYE